MATIELSCRILDPFYSAPNTPYVDKITVVPLFLTETIVLPMHKFIASEAVGVMLTGQEREAETAGRQVVHYAQGIVKESGIAVCRKVCAVRRNTIALLASTMSDVNGRFLLEWRGYAGKVVILIFDDTADALDYNCKVFDLVESVY